MNQFFKKLDRNGDIIAYVTIGYFHMEETTPDHVRREESMIQRATANTI
jgi:hypothetical protein